MALTSDFNPSAPNVTYQRMRMLLQEQGGGIQAGVVGATDLKVAQRGAGANMSVDVPAGAAWVAVTTGTRNGLAHVYNDATANVAVTASNATNPRVDSILLRYNDSTVPTGSGSTPTLEVATGTATAGAQAATPGAAGYRAGAATPTGDFLRLADILVPATSTSVTTANIVDRRPWARGAYRRIMRTTASYTTTSAGFAPIDATNLQPRIECSGGPVRMSLLGQFAHSVASGISGVFPGVDGSFADGAGAAAAQLYAPPGANGNTHLDISWVTVPSAGSHLLGPLFAIVTAGTLTVFATATIPLVFTVEELVRPSADNS
jgi:hypothetical protein